MVVVDTDFFSSLFKISELNLILKLLNIDKIIIPSTVYEELKDANFFNDKCARKIAKEEGLKVLSIPSFLADCKRKNILSNEKLKQIIKDLKEKDYYEFSEEVESLLLA